jgi:predicted protein tyrosine phosphatase
MNILFICGKNKWRSPTAEQIFSDYSGIDCLSAGLSPESDTPVSPELLLWAERIFVMEKAHKTKLSEQFSKHLDKKRIICLNIPDRYRFMDPALIRILERKVIPHLP